MGNVVLIFKYNILSDDKTNTTPFTGKKMWKMGNVVLIFKYNILSDDKTNTTPSTENGLIRKNIIYPISTNPDKNLTNELSTLPNYWVLVSIVMNNNHQPAWFLANEWREMLSIGSNNELGWEVGYISVLLRDLPASHECSDPINFFQESLIYFFSQSSNRR